MLSRLFTIGPFQVDNVETKLKSQSCIYDLYKVPSSKSANHSKESVIVFPEILGKSADFQSI